MKWSLLANVNSCSRPTITNIVNLSLSSSQFLLFLKSQPYPLFSRNAFWAMINSLTTVLSPTTPTYPTLLNVLSYLDLLIFLSSNNLLNPHQSACCKHHSTETALLYIHDPLTDAIASQKIPCLCLIDLYATFDTINHSILMTLLSSWFVFHEFVVNWFKSYLSSRSFRVKCHGSFASSRISTCGVPQGSVLGPFLFIMYTISLSTLISSLSLNHHLHADDTQPFLSFSPSNLDSSITITSRMLCKLCPPGGLRTF